MSSFIRTLQRAVKRKISFDGRASKLGVRTPTAEDNKARLKREAKREAESKDSTECSPQGGGR